MSNLIAKLNKKLSEYSKSSEGISLELRLSFAEMIYAELDRKGWTQRKLCQESGMADAVVSNILHGDRNFTVDTAGKLLSAIGLRARFTEQMDAQGNAQALKLRLTEDHGEPQIINESGTGSKVEYNQDSIAENEITGRDNPWRIAAQ